MPPDRSRPLTTAPRGCWRQPPRRLHARAARPVSDAHRRGRPRRCPTTGLARDAGAFLILRSKAMAPLVGHFNHFSTPKRAGRLPAAIATDPSDATGAYYDERGKPMRASTQVSDPKFADRYIARTRAFLAA